MTKAALLPGISVRRLSDANGQDYIRLVYARSGGRPAGQLVQPLSAISQPNALRGELLKGGYKLDIGVSGQRLVEELQRLLPDEATPLFTQTGWIEHEGKFAFAFPDALVGDIQAEQIVAEAVKTHSIARGGVSGKLRHWKKGVAQPALHSQVASIAIIAAFASPLLRFSNLSESFVINIAGESSSGKSTAIAAAISVWGHPKNSQSWDATDEGIVNVAVCNSCMGLFLDDAERAATDPNERLKRVRALIHKVVSGRTRQYSMFAERDPTLQSRSYECVAFCSSPQTIESSAATGRSPLIASERVRFLEMRVPSGDEGGIFAIPAMGAPRTDTNTLATSLKSSTETYFGTPGRKWARYLVENHTRLKTQVERLTEEFHQKVDDHLGALQSRVASKFGLLYAAGILAARAGILPWTKDTVGAVTIRAFRDAVAVGFAEAFDLNRAILQLRALVYDESKVQKLEARLAELSPDAFDGYHVGKRIYLKLKTFEEVLANDSSNVPSKTDMSRLFARLINSGALLHGHSGGLTQDVRFDGKKNRKRLVFAMPQLFEEFQRSKKALGLPPLGRINL